MPTDEYTRCRKEIEAMIYSSTLLKRIIYVVILALLVFSPLPIGSVRPAPLLVIQILSFLVFVLWLLKSMKEGKKPFAGVKPYIPLLLFLIICLFQTVPMPVSVLGTVSGNSLRIWESTRSVLSDIGSAAGMNFFTISVYPDATLKKTLLFLSYFVFGVVVSRTFMTTRKLNFILFPVFALLAFEAASGIYQYLSSGGTVDARGTFFNRNHFAGFLEMSFPLALGYVLSLGDWSRGGKKTFMRRLISSENAQKHILFLFLLGIILLAVILSKSRAGIFSMLVSLLFFYLLASRFIRKGLEIKWMIYVVLTVAFFFGLYIGLYPLVERYLLIEEELPARTLVWKDIISIIKDFPLFGTGLGTFGYVYPLYKISIKEPIVYLYSHNDYLQIIAETGILGFFSLMAALVLFVMSSMRVLVRLSSEQDYFRFFLLLGTLTGILAILIHSFVDFNLQIPSNGLYFAFLIGFSVALGSESEISRD